MSLGATVQVLRRPFRVPVLVRIVYTCYGIELLYHYTLKYRSYVVFSPQPIVLVGILC